GLRGQVACSAPLSRERLQCSRPVKGRSISQSALEAQGIRQRLRSTGQLWRAALPALPASQFVPSPHQKQTGSAAALTLPLVVQCEQRAGLPSRPPRETRSARTSAGGPPAGS